MNNSLNSIDQILNESLIGASNAMQKLKGKIKTYAPYNINILLTGETGTGKSLIAESIHKINNNNNGFVPVDLGAIPSALIESTLFGYIKGAFTGAETDKTGYVDKANNGTLFFDEIQYASTDLQTKILRLCETGNYYPVGGEKDPEKKSNCRFIFATNQDISKLLKKKKLLNDLYYRICSFRIYVPALRERSEDLIDLFKHFWEKESKIISISNNINNTCPEIDVNLLKSHKWPGNLRELRSFVMYCIIHKNRAESTDMNCDGLFNEWLIEQKIQRKGSNFLIEFQKLVKKHQSTLISEENLKRAYYESVHSINQNNQKTAEILNVDTSTIIKRDYSTSNKEINLKYDPNNGKPDDHKKRINDAFIYFLFQKECTDGQIHDILFCANELFMNCIKHALKGKESSLRLNQEGENNKKLILQSISTFSSTENKNDFISAWVKENGNRAIQTIKKMYPESEYKINDDTLEIIITINL